MSQNEPKIAEVPEVVHACPLCGGKFTEPISANKKHTCPDEGGCGQSFLVKVYS